jgi:hypothetical protein
MDLSGPGIDVKLKERKKERKKDTKGIGIENKVTLRITTIDIKGLSDCQQLDACYKHMTLKNKKNCKGIRQHKDSGQGSVALDFP